jgi:ribose transport system permease protein
VIVTVSKPAKRRIPLLDGLRRILSTPEVGVLVPLVILVAVFTLGNKNMLNTANLMTMLRAMSYTGIIVIGQTMLMIAGEIDLSVGGGGACASGLVSVLMVKAGWPWQAAVAVTMLIGIPFGLFNGLVTVKVGVPAFVVTLGTMYAARGLGDVLTDGNYIWGLPQGFVDLGKATPLGMTWSFWILIVLVVVFDFLMRQSIFGSMVTATGGNKQAARVTGINTDWVKIACFVITSELAVLAGVLVTGFMSIGDSHVFIGMELDTIASCVIGGVSLFGGVGTILGSFLGTAVLQAIRSGLVMVSINIDWQQVAVGTILAAAAGFDLLRRRAKKY